jgi:hypothetical protein
MAAFPHENTRIGARMGVVTGQPLGFTPTRFPKMGRTGSFSVCADWKRRLGARCCQESARAKIENGNSPSEGARPIGSHRSFPCATPLRASGLALLISVPTVIVVISLVCFALPHVGEASRNMQPLHGSWVNLYGAYSFLVWRFDLLIC